MAFSDSKIVMIREAFDIDPANTEGLVLRVLGGFRVDSLGFHSVLNATLTLVASDVNFVEMSDVGVISANIVGFTAGATWLYEVETNATVVIGVKDFRFAEDADAQDLSNVANANVIGGKLVLFRIAIADASADTDVVMTHKVRVIDVWIQNTGIAAHATDDHVQLFNGANAITNEIVKTATVEAVIRVSTIKAAEQEIDAGDDMTVTAVKVTNAACVVYVLAVRVG